MCADTAGSDRRVEHSKTVVTMQTTNINQPIHTYSTTKLSYVQTLDPHANLTRLTPVVQS